MPGSLYEALWAILTVSLHDLWDWWVHAPVWISIPLAVVVIGGPYVLADLFRE